MMCGFYFYCCLINSFIVLLYYIINIFIYYSNIKLLLRIGNLFSNYMF